MSYPKDMRVLLLTNLVYGFVMPVIEIFVGAYVMRNSNNPALVVIYQLAVYTGIPLTFLLNGFLMRYIKMTHLYSLGMLLSGVSMAFLMSLKHLSLIGIAETGLIMGLSFGLYWSNRDFLALSSTNDTNRNYYYGLENFFSTAISIVVPFAIGAFITAWIRYSLFGGHADSAYQAITLIAFVLAIIASVIVHQGRFSNPPPTKFIYFRFHWLWTKLQFVAILRGLNSGYIVTAPAMLIMRLVGKEGSVGVIQSMGAIGAAFLIYTLGRTTLPKHRIYIFSLGLLIFALGTLPNAILFNATGVFIFTISLTLARPLQDIAYYTMQMLVIDTVSQIEHRNKFAYILNQEIGYFFGRASGCILFIFLAYRFSDVYALRYALPIVASLQLGAALIFANISKSCRRMQTDFCGESSCVKPAFVEC